MLLRLDKVGRTSKHCSREDSNLHGFPHTVLSRTRLPVPPREQKQRGLIMPAWQRACNAKSKRLLLLNSLRSFLARTYLQLMRFAHVTKRTQEIGIVGHDNVVIFRRLLLYLFPALKRGLIELRSLGVIT